MKKICLLIGVLVFAGTFAAVAVKQPKSQSYNIYFGNTHAHSNYSGDIAIFRGKKGLSLDPKNSAEWHFALAKENGYDFYCVTDHSQYPEYTLEAFADVKAQSEKATDAKFVGIRGYEHSENNGPDGTGHMNVYNSDTYLSALDDEVSLEYFHNWLAKPENKKVVVCFNHPTVNAYNDFKCYNEVARGRMSMIELFNGKSCKYPAFVNALSKGWKVSPVAGCDNHGVEGIAKWGARTGVAATELTYDAIMEAMAAGRTYATLDKNLKIIYYVNGKPMGSTISGKSLKFTIDISDPDVSDPGSKITKIEIVAENGKLIQSKECAGYDINWIVDIPVNQKYYYIRVYNASMTEPVAYAAPVWVE